MGLVVLLLLTAVLPAGHGHDATAVYYTPVFILLLALLSAVTLVSCWRRKANWKQLGFYLMHIGVVVILGGAFAGYVAGEKGNLQLQLLRPEAVNALPGERPVPLGLEVGAKDFEVKFYPPMYEFYRQLHPDDVVPGQMPFEKVCEYDVTGKESLDLGDLGSIPVASLWDEARGEWTQRRMLDGGSLLHLASQTPSHYGVTLQIVDGDHEVELPISINHPAGYKKWRFYLMSYDQRSRSYVVLSARHDPGRDWVIAGIWATMIGSFMLGFRREGGAK